MRTRLARATYFSVCSMFFSFTSTYHSPCRSSNDFKRSSRASHSRPLTSSFCLSSGKNRIGSRNAFRPSLDRAAQDPEMPRAVQPTELPRAHAVSPNAGHNAVRRASLTSACIVVRARRSDEISKPWPGHEIALARVRTFVRASVATMSSTSAASHL